MLIVVAEHRDESGQGHQQIHGGGRVRPVTDAIAETHKLLDTVCQCPIPACGQGLKIAVDIGKDGDLHVQTSGPETVCQPACRFHLEIRFRKCS